MVRLDWLDNFDSNWFKIDHNSFDGPNRFKFGYKHYLGYDIMLNLNLS